MKIHSDRRRNALILMVAYMFFNGNVTSQVIGAEPQARRMVVTPGAFARPENGAARLIVQRIANLGNYVRVQLSADGRGSCKHRIWPHL
jgi:hypothetical protein